MRYQHIIQAAYYEPWLITATAHAAILSLIESHLASSSYERAGREGIDFCGDKVQLPGMTISDGIAQIPIGGVMGSRLSAMEKGSGAVDTGDIENEINQAESSKEVRSILFDIDSPGGMVSGTPELAARIAAIRKPKYSFVNLAASAAYWVASATDGIFGTTSSEAGGIGVYMPWIDRTRAFEQRGLKVDLIKAGKLKGTGFPGTALTEAQRAHLQERVDQIYEMFSGHVRATRGPVSDETMQGQTFLASEAASRGLIDGVVKSKEDVLGML